MAAGSGKPMFCPLAILLHSDAPVVAATNLVLSLAIGQARCLDVQPERSPEILGDSMAALARDLQVESGIRDALGCRSLEKSGSHDSILSHTDPEEIPGRKRVLRRPIPLRRRLLEQGEDFLSVAFVALLRES